VRDLEHERSGRVLATCSEDGYLLCFDEAFATSAPDAVLARVMAHEVAGHSVQHATGWLFDADPSRVLTEADADRRAAAIGFPRHLGLENTGIADVRP
jgi:hypothetical protein